MKNEKMILMLASFVVTAVMFSGCTKASNNSGASAPITQISKAASQGTSSSDPSVKSMCSAILKLYETKGITYTKTETAGSIFESGNLPIKGVGVIPKIVDGRDRSQGVFMCSLESQDQKGSSSSVLLHIEIDVDHNKASDVKPLIKRTLYFEALEPDTQSKLDSFFEEKMKDIKADSYFDPQAEITVGRTHMRIMTVQKDSAMNFHLIVELSTDY